MEQKIKQIIAVILLTTIAFSGFSQEKSIPKFQWSVEVGTNQAFFSDKEGIQDFTGVSLKDVTLGYNLAGRVKYNFSQKFSVVSGFTIINYERTAFKYYGITYLKGIGRPQIPICMQYNLSKKHDSWFVSAGAIISFELHSGFIGRGYGSDLVRPAREVETRDIAGVRPLLQIGLGKIKSNTNGRMTERYLYFNKGFTPAGTVNLIRYYPTIESNFSQKRTSLNFSYRWYLKRLKN